MSILSYFNVERAAAELKLRVKKAKASRVTKSTLKVLEQERIKRYQESLSVREIVSEVLSDCVEAISAAAEASRREGKVLERPEAKVVTEEISQSELRKKRKHM